MEEKKYLYPDGKVEPLKCGDGFEDYLLSEVLDVAGVPFLSGRMEFAAENVEFVDGRPALKAYCIAVIRNGLDTFIALAPIARCRPYREFMKDIGRINVANNIRPTDAFDDLVIRYYIKDREILRPVWVEAIIGGTRKCSVFGGTDYCTELISGPLISRIGNWPELPIVSSYLTGIK